MGSARGLGGRGMGAFDEKWAGAGQMGGGGGKKSEFWAGVQKKGKKGAGVGRKSFGGGRGVVPGSPQGHRIEGL